MLKRANSPDRLTIAEVRPDSGVTSQVTRRVPALTELCGSAAAHLGTANAETIIKIASNAPFVFILGSPRSKHPFGSVIGSEQPSSVIRLRQMPLRTKCPEDSRTETAHRILAPKQPLNSLP